MYLSICAKNVQYCISGVIRKNFIKKNILLDYSRRYLKILINRKVLIIESFDRNKGFDELGNFYE